MPNPIVRKTPKRGRPGKSKAERDDMRLQISGVAKTLFQQEGYAKISMRRIAKEIGCTPMTLYGYYNRKIDILRTLWGDVFLDLFDRLRAATPDTDPRRYLKTLCVTYTEYWIDHPDYYRLVFMAEGVTQPDVSVFLDNPDIVAQYGIFLEALRGLETVKQTDDVKPKLDFMISAMHGIANSVITINGYEWSSAEAQIQFILDGVL